MTSNIDKLFEQLLTTLQISEKRHRVVRDSASDNSNWNTYDNEGELISNIIKWRRKIESLHAEIVVSGAISDEDVSREYRAANIQVSRGNIDSISMQSELLLNFDDGIKVGTYIRGKLRELSSSGYVFSATQIQQLCDVSFSKIIFSYQQQLPFAKKYNSQQDLIVQIKDESGKNRYWNEVFRFGDIELLIISQWYAKDKESFDKWYEGLPSLSIATQDTLICRKTVDSPSPDYGISIFLHNRETVNNSVLEESTGADKTETKSETADIMTKPTKITLFGKEYLVRAWNEVFVKVCTVMLLHRPYTMAVMDRDNEFNTEISRSFSYRESDMKSKGKRLSNGMWIETENKQKDMLEYCRKLIEKCGFLPDELQVETMEGI